VKSALSLVVHLLLEHLNVPEEKSSIEDLLMKDIKKSSKEETNHSNSIGKVNASFAFFFIAMLLLFDAFIDHNAQTASAPWAGSKLFIEEQSLFQQNQKKLVKFCLHQNEDQAWKLFGKRKLGHLGWSVSYLDSLWGSSVQ
jgi:hypothetical protein